MEKEEVKIKTEMDDTIFQDIDLETEIKEEVYTSDNDYREACEEHPIAFHCTECEKSFVLYLELKEHQKIQHNKEEHLKTVKEEIIETPIMSKTTTKISKLYSCKFCGKSFKDRNRVNQHEFIHLPPQFQCDVCFKKYTWKAQLQTHLKNVHLKLFSEKQCEFCQKKIRETFYKQHIRFVHQKSKVHECDMCQQTFIRYFDMVRHQKEIHFNQKRFECDICHNKYGRSYDLRVHRTTHFGANFECTMCDKKFLRKNHLKRHILEIHSSSPKLTCNECGRTFINRKEIKAHLKKCYFILQMKNNKNVCSYKELFFKCDLCEKLFKDRHSLTQHENSIHKGIRYHCTLCPKAYTRKRMLKLHISTKHKYSIKTADIDM